LAAFLADQGFTGSLDVVEAQFGGFLSTMRGQFGAETILSELGKRWEIARVGLKPYAACASSHNIVDGVRELRQRGLTADNLAQLSIRMTKKGHVNIGWPYKPGDVVAAQMNGYYIASVTLLDGDAFIEQFDERRLTDPKVMALLPRINIVHDPKLDRAGAAKRHAVHVDALLNDGNRLSTYVEQRRGSAEHPLSKAEIEQKFRRLAANFLSDSNTTKVMSIVQCIEREADIRLLMSLLTKRSH